MGLLKHGCQPLKVSLDTYGTLEMHRNSGLQLLHSLAEASSVAPLPTRELEATLPAFTAETAALILSAFPRLERLRRLDCRWSEEDQGPATLQWSEVHADFAAALQLLLDRERGAPHLTFLDLGDYAPTTPAVRRALSGSTQLTGLKLGVLRSAAEAQAISTLTSLRSLDLWCYDGPVLKTVLSPLTALTSLRLWGERGWGRHLSPALAGMPRLASLDYKHGYLDVSVLATLTALTNLDVYALVLPEASGGAIEALAAPAHRHPWQLPPQLKSIHLYAQAPEPLHVLRSSPVRKLSWFIVGVQLAGGVHLVYDPGHRFAADMTPYGEAALCAVAEFLTGRVDDDSRIGLVCAAELRCFPIRCVGGAAEAGPGQMSHTVWLAAMGRAGVPRLELDRLALSHQDFEVLAGHTGLKVLQLGSNAEYPPSALLSLPLAPRLERLELNVELWCPHTGEDEDASEDEGEAEDSGSDDDSDPDGDPDGGEARAGARAAALPPDLRHVLTELLAMNRRLRVALVNIDDDGPSLRARRLLTALAADVRSAVERLAGDGGRLQAQGSMSTGPRGL
ncbi:hypothetical protein HYH03_013877 [Edaphochlamys debaryana]|uniref:Uncharacterized protein n=1 Tax=Edaphochlamys debaryana TaxID=47281 RepID=A0A836BU68_9CHLO|nr:hypothetical protein HYH03_013877 [Edaphochlamys debaryana]|eukprot:KAG2487599.1 hypothetical protein HYH03_013877 [Edaphochlamys debaryana]